MSNVNIKIGEYNNGNNILSIKNVNGTTKVSIKDPSSNTNLCWWFKDDGTFESVGANTGRVVLSEAEMAGWEKNCKVIFACPHISPESTGQTVFLRHTEKNSMPILTVACEKCVKISPEKDKVVLFDVRVWDEIKDKFQLIRIGE